MRLIPNTPALFRFLSVQSVAFAVDNATSDDEHAVSIATDGPVKARVKEILPAATLSADPVAEKGVIFLMNFSTRRE